jgi:hypothetical protein
MEHTLEWADNVEVAAFANVSGCRLRIANQVRSCWETITPTDRFGGWTDNGITIYLYYNGLHYDLLVQKNSDDDEDDDDEEHDGSDEEEDDDDEEQDGDDDGSDEEEDEDEEEDGDDDGSDEEEDDDEEDGEEEEEEDEKEGDGYVMVSIWIPSVACSSTIFTHTI